MQYFGYPRGTIHNSIEWVTSDIWQIWRARGATALEVCQNQAPTSHQTAGILILFNGERVREQIMMYNLILQWFLTRPLGWFIWVLYILNDLDRSAFFNHLLHCSGCFMLRRSSHIFIMNSRVWAITGSCVHPVHTVTRPVSLVTELIIITVLFKQVH